MKFDFAPLPQIDNRILAFIGTILLLEYFKILNISFLSSIKSYSRILLVIIAVYMFLGYRKANKKTTFLKQITKALRRINNIPANNYDLFNALVDQYERKFDNRDNQNINRHVFENTGDRVIHKRIPRKVTETVKKHVAANQQWRCNGCRHLLDASYEIDHVKPLYLGGNNAVENLQALCRNCHGKKTVEDRLFS